MAKRILDQAEVNAAAEAILATGKKPNGFQVFLACGNRGSISTASKMMKIWEETREATGTVPPPPVELPADATTAIEDLVAQVADTVRAFGNDVHRHAQSLSAKRIAEMQAALDAKDRDLAEQMANVTQVVDAKQEELEAIEGECEKLRALVAEQAGTIGHLQGETKAQTDRIAALETSRQTEAQAAATRERDAQAQIAALSRDLGVLTGQAQSHATERASLEARIRDLETAKREREAEAKL